jgi:hypothetical protein
LRTQDQKIWSAPVPSGTRIVTGFVHSVEKTPVEDVYIVSGGRIWLWEERFRSHNAGLPTEPPKHGRFLLHKDWMIVQGSSYEWETLRVRIGDSQIGKNWFSSTMTGKLDLFQTIPNSLLYVEMKQVPLFFKKMPFTF